MKPVSNTVTSIRISISRKNKKTDRYENDFSGYVRVIGSYSAAEAARLQKMDRIRLGETDVSTFYDKDKGKEYVNYKLFSFESPGKLKNGHAGTSAPAASDARSVPDYVEEGDHGYELPY